MSTYRATLIAFVCISTQEQDTSTYSHLIAVCSWFCRCVCPRVLVPFPRYQHTREFALIFVLLLASVHFPSLTPTLKANPARN